MVPRWQRWPSSAPLHLPRVQGLRSPFPCPGKLLWPHRCGPIWRRLRHQSRPSRIVRPGQSREGRNDPESRHQPGRSRRGELHQQHRRPPSDLRGHPGCRPRQQLRPDLYGLPWPPGPGRLTHRQRNPAGTHPLETPGAGGSGPRSPGLKPMSPALSISYSPG